MLRGLDPAVERLVDAFKKRDGGRAMKAVRRLYRLYIDYPTETVVHVVRDVERFGLIDLARIEKLVLTHIAGEFFRLPLDDAPGEDIVNDDIDQLLKNLKLRRLREIISAELERAEKKKPSYSEFIARVLREEYQHQQERFLEYRIDRANLPERWTLETFPWKEQPGVSKAQVEQLAELDFIPRAAEPGVHRRHRCGQDGACQRHPAARSAEGYRGLFIKAQDLFDECTAASPTTPRARSSTSSCASTCC